MNVFNSLDGLNSFLISDLDYEMMNVIKSSMKSEKKNIKARINRLKFLLKDCDDKCVEKDYKSQIEYFEYLCAKIDLCINSIEQVLDNKFLK